MRTVRAKERGVTILTVMVIVIIIAGVSSAFFLLSMNEAGMNEKNRYKMRATYLAEAGVELAANRLRIDAANDPGIIQTKKGDPNYVSYDTNFTVIIDGTPVLCKATKHDGLEPTEIKGLFTYVAYFEILGYARVGGNPKIPLSQPDATAQEGLVYRVIEAKGSPLFQFLAFYDDDMELNPGPYAHFHGRVHSNGDMYLTSRAGTKGLILDTDHVQSAGKFFRVYKQGTESGANGDVYIRKQGTNKVLDSIVDGSNNPDQADPGLVKWGLSLDSNSSGFTNTATTNWNTTVKDKSMGADKMVPPDLKSIQPGGFWNDYAAKGDPMNPALGVGLVIQDGKVYQGAVANSNDITSNLPPGTVTTTSIWDAREGKKVPLVTVDVGKLMGSTYRPKNGVIYVTDTTATGSNLTGVKLTNGSYIPDKTVGGANVQGLSVVSNLPVYVEGDFNGKTDKSTGASMADVINPGTPNEYSLAYTQDAGGAKKPTQPCSIMADAVNLLSNNWDNSKVPGGGVPGAGNTTFNFAMVAGDVVTKFDPKAPDQGYNGGLQNLPRFHENWSGIRCNIAGSFVNLWNSQLATGPYGKGGVYTPPNRHWDYDMHFETAGGLPPGTPYSSSIGRTTYEEGYVRPSNYTFQPK